MAKQDWNPVYWYCGECGTRIMGFKNKRNKVKGECPKCKIYYVRTYEGRHHRSMKMFYPEEDGVPKSDHAQLNWYTGGTDEMKQAT